MVATKRGTLPPIFCQSRLVAVTSKKLWRHRHYTEPLQYSFAGAPPESTYVCWMLVSVQIWEKYWFWFRLTRVQSPYVGFETQPWVSQSPAVNQRGRKMDAFSVRHKKAIKTIPSFLLSLFLKAQLFRWNQRWLSRKLQRAALKAEEIENFPRNAYNMTTGSLKVSNSMSWKLIDLKIDFSYGSKFVLVKFVPTVTL